MTMHSPDVDPSTNGSSGVHPSPSVIGRSPSNSGSSSRYRHIVASRAASESFRQARAAARS